MLSRRALLLLPLLFTTACRDNPSEPEPAGADLTGEWSYSVPELATSNATCSFSGVTLTIAQTGSTFAGTAEGGSNQCVVNGDVRDGIIIPQQIGGGVVSGKQVSFRFGGADFRNAGAVAGDSISGTVTWHTEDNLTLTGRFTAIRR